MAHLSKDLFTEWKDGDIIDAPTYVQERELIRTAINHNDETSKDNKQELQDNVDELAGAGRTTETVKKNADDVKAVDAKADGIRQDLTTLDTTVTSNKTEQDVLKAKLAGIEEGAEVNQNAFAKVNNLIATKKTDAFTIEGGTGVVVTTDPATKKITLEATGEALPASHGHSHNVNGSDPIPDLIKHIQSANPHGISSETVNHLPVNAFTNADLATAYPMGLTIMRVDGNNIVPFPYTGGVSTFRVSSTTGYQFLARSGTTNTLLFRQTVSGGGWDEWDDVMTLKQSDQRYVGKRTLVLEAGTHTNIDVSNVDLIVCTTAVGSDCIIASLLPSPLHRVRVLKNNLAGRLIVKYGGNMLTSGNADLILDEASRGIMVELQANTANNWYGSLVSSHVQTRNNNGQFEVFIGGVWKGVGTQRCVPSNNIKHQENATRSRGTSESVYTLVLKYFPEALGEIHLRAEILVPVEPFTSGSLKLGSPNASRFQGSLYTNGGSGVSVHNAPPIGGGMPSATHAQFDWRTPINTQVNFGTQDTYRKHTSDLLFVPSVPSGGVWTNVSTVLHVTEIAPIYLFLASSGGTTQIRNISIAFDIL